MNFSEVCGLLTFTLCGEISNRIVYSQIQTLKLYRRLMVHLHVWGNHIDRSSGFNKRVILTAYSEQIQTFDLHLATGTDSSVSRRYH